MDRAGWLAQWQVRQGLGKQAAIIETRDPDGRGQPGGHPFGVGRAVEQPLEHLAKPLQRQASRQQPTQLLLLPEPVPDASLQPPGTPAPERRLSATSLTALVGLLSELCGDHPKSRGRQNLKDTQS